MPDPAAHPRTTPATDEATRVFARLVSAKHEIADTVEDQARGVIAHRASTVLAVYASGRTTDHTGPRSGAGFDARLERVLVAGAHCAGRDLAGRVAADVQACHTPRPVVTPHFLLGVDAAVTSAGTRVTVDYDPDSGPDAADVAVRLLEAGANHDPDTVGVIATTTRYLAGADGLYAALDWLAELGAGLLRKDGS